MNYKIVLKALQEFIVIYLKTNIYFRLRFRLGLGMWMEMKQRSGLHDKSTTSNAELLCYISDVCLIRTMCCF